MALNDSPERSDLGFLRRRRKSAPARTAPAVDAPASTSPAADREASAGMSLAADRPASAGLSLSPASQAPAASPAPVAAPSAVSPDSLPFPAPAFTDVRELGDNQPVLRLNARRSAVGSLIVSGADTAIWEDADRVTGSATAAGDTAGTPVTTPGNRPLVGFDETDALVSLRHLRRLRRALFIGRGPEPLGVQLFNGSTITIARGDDSRMFILRLLEIGNLLELRAEPVDRALSDEQIFQQFGFTLTPHVTTRESRSR